MNRTTFKVKGYIFVKNQLNMEKTFTLKKLAMTLCVAMAFTKVSGQTSSAATSLHFDGANDHCNRAIFSTATTSITMEARVQWGGASPGNKTIMSNGTTTLNGYAMFVPSGTSSLAVRCGASVFTTTYNLIPQFTMLSMVIGPGPVGNTILVYANGNQVYSGFISAITAPSGSFSIGGNNAGTENFIGAIDEARFWNRALCPAEIMHRAFCQPQGTEPNLTACYRFNQGLAGGSNPTVTVLTDLTANNYTCALNNFSLTGATSNWVAPPGGFTSFCTYAPATLSITPTGSVSVCSGNSATLAVLGSTSYTWNTSSNLTTIVITPTAATTSYSVLGNNPAAPCYGMATKTVAMIPSPTVATVSSASLICAGQTATLTASGATTYTWNTTANTAVIAVTPTTTTSYTVSGTAANGCTGSSVIIQNVSACTGLASLNGTQPTFITVYPNPSNGDIYIYADTEMNLSVVNSLGQVVKVISVNAANNYKVQVNNLSTGIYFVVGKNNNKVISQKIIITK